MHKVYLSLGSNIGCGKKNINDAVTLLRNDKNIFSLRLSSFYKTKPVGYTDQNDFTNAVCMIETTLEPYELLKLCLSIERKLGRIRTIKWGPRIIDLDILLYDDLKIEGESLTVPHKLMFERAFVLVPLRELEPNMFDYENLPSCEVEKTA